MKNTKIINRLIDYYLEGSELTQDEHNNVRSLKEEMQAINYTPCCETLKDRKPSFMEFERSLKKDIFDGEYGWLYNGSWLAKKRLKEVWLEKYYI